MGMYKYLQTAWQSEQMKEILKARMISWRVENAIIKIDYPSRLDRAHALGYKAKQGFVLARVRISKGSNKREVPSGGRKPSHAGLTKNPPNQNLQHIAEIRASKHFPNLEVLNSYYVGEDGRDQWFEIILVDPSHPAIRADKKINWICNVSGRAERGLTSSAKRHRMLMGKGRGFERRNNPEKR